ncbi:hypothetical protein Tco_0198167, partial [Tanacetum coccineum]
PSDDVEEREEEEVPLRRKRSAYRRARTAVVEPAGPSGDADKGKAPIHDLDIPTEFLAEDAQARKRFEEEQASERLVQQLRTEDLAQEYMPNVSAERAKELDDLMMRITETDWLNLMMQVGSNPTPPLTFPEPPVRQPSVESSNLEKPDNPPIVTMADNRTITTTFDAFPSNIPTFSPATCRWGNISP